MCQLCRVHPCAQHACCEACLFWHLHSILLFDNDFIRSHLLWEISFMRRSPGRASYSWEASSCGEVSCLCMVPINEFGNIMHIMFTH